MLRSVKLYADLQGKYLKPYWPLVLLLAGAALHQLRAPNRHTADLASLYRHSPDSRILTFPLCRRVYLLRYPTHFATVQGLRPLLR